MVDGWGYREKTARNAIANARSPLRDKLWEDYPRTLIRSSEGDAGLPAVKQPRLRSRRLSVIPARDVG